MTDVAVKRVALLGKGSLAIHAGELVARAPDMSLDTVVPVADEPDWDTGLSDHAARHWPHALLLPSGDWRELEPDRYDLVLSILYDRIIGRRLIEGSGRAINLHPGPLPRYRGVRPVNWALRNGERMHGVTLHEIDEGIDSGPVLAQALFTIWPEIDEVRDVWARSMAVARTLLDETLPRFDRIPAVPQDQAKALTYYRAQNHELGDRSDWTRAQSTSLLKADHNAK
ncbi:formyltransferase family protein [Streptomyces sp. NPDC050636]|uniref:formyltransferase family protein n=1 Tax=Streptomyces sp. NPDC050636 TaxID=3154510 RepID=UPI00341997C2